MGDTVTVRRAPRCLRRGWWMLRIIGQPAALLDGGLDEAPFDERVDAVRSVARGGGVARSGAAVVARSWHRAGGVVVDSRGAARYAGDAEPIDRGRHIPGDQHPFAGNLRDGHSCRAWTSPHSSRRWPATRRRSYCGRASRPATTLAMASAGLPLPRVYVGSWSGWISSGYPSPPARNPVKETGWQFGVAGCRVTATGW